MRTAIRTCVALTVLCSGFTSDLAAQSLCGTYETLAGATVRYEYDVGGLQTTTLPLQATLTFDCQFPSMAVTAYLRTPILGVGADGTVIYPIGGLFPLTVEGQSSDGHDFAGTLLAGSQYQFQWQFVELPNELVRWNGWAGWTGGRLEMTTFSDVTIVAVPEPGIGGFGLLSPASLVFVWWRARRFGGGKR